MPWAIGRSVLSGHLDGDGARRHPWERLLLYALHGACFAEDVYVAMRYATSQTHLAVMSRVWALLTEGRLAADALAASVKIEAIVCFTCLT